MKSVVLFKQVVALTHLLLVLKRIVLKHLVPKRVVFIIGFLEHIVYFPPTCPWYETIV